MKDDEALAGQITLAAIFITILLVALFTLV